MKRPPVWPVLAALAACAGAPEPPTVVIPSGPAAPSMRMEATSADRVPAARPARPIAWETSEQAARERARRTGLPLVVWISAEWAAPGAEMERKTWTDPRVQVAAEGFVALRLDLSAAEGDAERYAEVYEVKGLPSTVFFDGRGRRVVTLFGYQDAAATAAALKRAAEP